MPVGPAEHDGRTCAQHALEHLPAIATQPYIHPCLDFVASHDRLKPASQARGSNNGPLEWDRIGNDMGRKQSNTGAQALCQAPGRFESSERRADVCENHDDLESIARNG
jgi:hypothetical protein